VRRGSVRTACLVWCSYTGALSVTSLVLGGYGVGGLYAFVTGALLIVGVSFR